MEITEHIGERWVTTIFVQNKYCNDCRKTSRCLEASRMIICTDFEESILVICQELFEKIFG